MPKRENDGAKPPLTPYACAPSRRRVAFRTAASVVGAAQVWLVAVAIVLALSPIVHPAGSAAAPPAALPLLLVFTRTTGYRHASIPTAVAAVRAIGRRDNFTVVATEDPRAFADAPLRRFRAVAFLLTTGTVLDASQRAALERFVHRGGGWLGVHSASDTEYAWPFYGRLVGAYFRRHPAIQPAVVDVVDRSNPATASLPVVWRRVDEWYDVRRNQRGRVHVLATVDERSYRGGGMGRDHPIVWCHEDLGGRAFYTAMGHTIAAYHEPLFLAHLRGALDYVLGRGPACR